MPTTISGGTPNWLSARASVARLRSQKRTPARMRTGSMKRLRYTRQFLAVPRGGGSIRRGTLGKNTAWPIMPRTQSAGRPRRAAMPSAKRMASARSA